MAKKKKVQYGGLNGPVHNPSCSKAESGILVPGAIDAKLKSIGDVLDGEAIRREIVGILTNPKMVGSERHKAVANSVVDALMKRGKFFFHAERRDFDSAMYFDGHRKRLELIRSDAFNAWTSQWTALNMADPTFRFVMAAIDTAALGGLRSSGILPELFWAARPGAIYLSCGDGAIIRIKPRNVEVVDNGTDNILFVAGSTLKPWQLADDPRDPFETCAAFRDTSCAAQHGLDLLRLWLFSLPTNPACKPPLCSCGSIGSGKTRTARSIAELYGLPFVANKAYDSGGEDFWTSLDAGGLFTLDNCDSRIRWLAEAVSAAATDGCSQRRKLYTDSQQITLRPHAWLCLTSANPTFGSDAALADRLLIIRMNRRTDETSEAQLSDEILVNRDAGLSYIAQTLQRALADKKAVPAGLSHRHPDFASFAVRIGRAIKREQESIAALQSAEIDKSLFCLENDGATSTVLAYLQTVDDFEGTASELLDALKEFDPDDMGAVGKNGKPIWSAKRLGKSLSVRWPHFEKILATAKHEKDRKGFTIYRLRLGDVPSVPSLNQPFPIKSHACVHGRKPEIIESNSANSADSVIEEAENLFDGTAELDESD